MERKCPKCGKTNVRRSAVRTPELTARHILFSPYRCRDCRERFWVISGNAYILAGIVVLSLAAGGLAWNVGALLDGTRRDQARVQPAAERFQELAKLAEKSDSNAEYEIAVMYTFGYGVAQSDAEAKKWLERASQHGNVAAQYEYGVALRDGRGMIQDYEQAFKWIRLAAEAGYSQAQFALGSMYRTGVGVPIDNVKAYTWLNVAAARGVPEAAIIRDIVLSRLSPAEIAAAQAEARRLTAAEPAQSTGGH